MPGGTRVQARGRKQFRVGSDPTRPAAFVAGAATSHGRAHTRHRHLRRHGLRHPDRGPSTSSIVTTATPPPAARLVPRLDPHHCWSRSAELPRSASRREGASLIGSRSADRGESPARRSPGPHPKVSPRFRGEMSRGSPAERPSLASAGRARLATRTTLYPGRIVDQPARRRTIGQGGTRSFWRPGRAAPRCPAANRGKGRTVPRIHRANVLRRSR